MVARLVALSVKSLPVVWSLMSLLSPRPSSRFPAHPGSPYLPKFELFASFGGMVGLGRLGQGTEEVDHGKREEGHGVPGLARLAALQLRRWLRDGGGGGHLAPAPAAHHRP